MSVLIKDMAMPISCERCPMLDWDLDYIKCKVTDRHFKMTECWRSIRVPDCPLVPVPPHGRLIDADALMNEFEKAQRTMQQHGREYSCSFMSNSQEISTEWYCVEDMLDNAPTIIEADGGE